MLNSRWREDGGRSAWVVVQFLFNGLVQASLVILGAIGINLLYGVKKFANFAHGDMMTLGAYFTLVFFGLTHDLVVGAFYAVFVVALVGLQQEILIYAQLETRRPDAALLAFKGLTRVVHDIIAFRFGPGFLTIGSR